jgi:hypothetical protein
MNNPEKLVKHRVYRTKTNKEKHNTICVGHHYAQANKNHRRQKPRKRLMLPFLRMDSC